MSNIVVKVVSLSAIGLVCISDSSLAQTDEDFFIRNKYEAVGERAQSEYDPIPVQLGALLARTEIGFSAGATTNLFATSSNETDDTFVGIAPSIDLESTWSRHSFGLNGKLDHIEYSDTSSESRTNISLGADGRLDVSGNFALFGALQIDDLTEPRSNIASLQNAAEPVEYARIGGEAGFRYQSGRVLIRGAAGVESFDFDDIELDSGLIQDQDFRDHDDLTGIIRTSYAVERDWALFVELDYSQSDYDDPNIFNAVNRDFSTIAARVGSDFELQSLVRGDIGIGAFQSEYDDPNTDDVSGLSVDGNLQWFVTQLTTMTFGAGRGVIDPGLIQTNASVRSNVSARADHELRRNVLLTGEVRFTNFDFENFDRNDDRWNFRTGAVWKINPNIWVNGFYELTDQSSNVQAFTENRVLVGLRVFP